jgi:hypothetical protein
MYLPDREETKRAVRRPLDRELVDFYVRTPADLRRLREGRGYGADLEYRPWIYVWEVPSIGESWRIRGWHAAREYHLLSKRERNFFFELEWSKTVIEVREQFPLLPISETLEIANALGVRHPYSRKAGGYVVMTSDFLITRRINGVAVDQVRSVKPSPRLPTRAQQKLHIERLYWERRDVPWRLVTDDQIDSVVAENVRSIHSYRDPRALRPLGPRDIERVGLFLDGGVAGHQPLARLALECDIRLGLEPSKSLAVARHLIAVRRWPVDITRPIHPAGPLPLIAPANLIGSQQPW